MRDYPNPNPSSVSKLGLDEISFIKWMGFEWELLVRKGKNQFISCFLGYRQRNVKPDLRLKAKVTFTIIDQHGNEGDLTETSKGIPIYLLNCVEDFEVQH